MKIFVIELPQIEKIERTRVILIQSQQSQHVSRCHTHKMATVAILGAVVSSERTEKIVFEVPGSNASVADGNHTRSSNSTSLESFGRKRTDVAWLQASPVYIVLNSVTPSVKNSLGSILEINQRWLR